MLASAIFQRFLRHATIKEEQVKAEISGLKKRLNEPTDGQKITSPMEAMHRANSVNRMVPAKRNVGGDANCESESAMTDWMW